MPLLPYLNSYPRVHPSVFLAEGACVIGDVEISEDCSLWFHTVVRGDVHPIRIGPRTNLQDLTVVHVTHDKYDTVIGADVTVGHRAMLHGCHIGDGCLIGMSATVMDGAEIGAGSLVAAGSLVTEGFHCPPGSLVLGFPAKVRRPLTPEEQVRVKEGALNYLGCVANYRKTPPRPR
ncbi:MAG: gamma carbonic anhydrase family protein [Planctomycetes bacterium]|nr:gamma carbonic anhydrase family protein [Planctomycetota bacterium]